MNRKMVITEREKPNSLRPFVRTPVETSTNRVYQPTESLFMIFSRAPTFRPTPLRPTGFDPKLFVQSY